MADFGVSGALAVASVLAAAGGAYATYSAAEAQSKAYKYNAEVADLQAQQARDAAKLEGETQAREDRRQQAAVRAAIGAAGVEPNEGSPLLVLMENARAAKDAQNRIEYAGELRAAGLHSQADLQRFYGQQAKTMGAYGAGVSLLGSAANIAGTYYKPSKSAKYTALQGAVNPYYGPS